MIEIAKICQEFNLQAQGATKQFVNKVTTIQNQDSDGLTWAKNLANAEKVISGVVLLSETLEIVLKPNVTYLFTKRDPKLILSLIVRAYFDKGADYYLKNEVKKHLENPNIKIGDHVFIGQNVTIGDGTVIYPFSSIEADSVIGENCIIKSHVSIGSEGLGVTLNEDTDLLVTLPQIGNVVMESNVDIGPNTTVRRGTLGTTLIKEGSKIGALINIGHNCIIGRNTILTCNIVTSGSSIIGDYTYLGVNSAIKNGITVGKNAFVGMGAIVTKSVPDNMLVYGNPAKIIRENE